MNTFEEVGNAMVLAHQGQHELAKLIWQRLVAFFVRSSRTPVPMDSAQQA